MITLQTPYVQFTELDGSPLDDGAVYIGTAGLNPQTNPITVYWDNAGTQPAAQPLSTRSGVIARNGTPARVYISASSYSLIVRDKRGRLVASELSINSSVDASGITDGTITEVKLDAALVAKINGALQTTGGTMTGAIVLPGNATNTLEAVPKQQAESIATAAAADRLQYSLTATQTATGLVVDFTSIPAWADRVTVMFTELSTNGTFNPIIQIGDSAFKTTGYAGSQTLLTSGVAVSNFSTGFQLGGANATSIRNGFFTIVRRGANTWVANGVTGFSDSAGIAILAGYVELTGALERIRFSAGGTDQFDNGTLSVLIEG